MVKQKPKLQGWDYGRTRTPQRGCLHTNLGRLYMGVKHRKKGLSPGSAHHINFPHLPTRPAHAPQPWQEGLGFQKSWPRKEGLTCFTPCPHFLSLQRGSQASALVLLLRRTHKSPIPISQGLCSLQEGQTLSPSIAQALTSTG